MLEATQIERGSSGSGNFHHAGRPGLVGGSETGGISYVNGGGDKRYDKYQQIITTVLDNIPAQDKEGIRIVIDGGPPPSPKGNIGQAGATYLPSSNTLTFYPQAYAGKQLSLYQGSIGSNAIHEIGHHVFSKSLSDLREFEQAVKKDTGRITEYALKYRGTAMDAEESFSELYRSYHTRGAGWVETLGREHQAPQAASTFLSWASKRYDSIQRGSVGSGNFGHSGRPGQVGGSAEGNGPVDVYKRSPIVGETFTAWRDRAWSEMDGDAGPHEGIYFRAMSDGEFQAAKTAGEFKPLVGSDLYITEDPDRLSGGAYGGKDSGGHIVEFDLRGDKVRIGGSRYVRGVKETLVNSIPWDRVSRIWSKSGGPDFILQGSVTRGSTGSGNFGHSGRPGQVGGSSVDNIGPEEQAQLNRVYLDSEVYGKETVGEALDRHGIQRTPNGLYVFYHGTPKTSKFDKLKPGSYLGTTEEASRFFAARDRGLKPNQIKVFRILAKPSELEPGVDWTVNTEVPVDRNETDNYYTQKRAAGPGRGNWGHSGRPGMVGGSVTGSGSHIGGKLERLEPDKRVWQGSQHPGTSTLSKLQTGALGEKIAMESLEAVSRIAYGTLNIGLNNAPDDAAGDHEAIEIKTGIATNTPAAQQFRATIGQPGKEESARLLHMSAEEKRMYNQHKSQQILKRKSAMLGKMSRLAGQKVTPYTVAVILSPDGKRGDVFKVPGFHLRLGWNDSIVKDNYIGTYTVGR